MNYDDWKCTDPNDRFLGSVKQKRRERNIVTVQHYSDIWTAAERDWDLGDPTGYGSTEQEAIQDLNDRLDDRDKERAGKESSPW